MESGPSDAAFTMLTELTDVQRRQALERYRQLRDHLEHDVPLAGVARDASLPLRTAQRWIGRYRQFGLTGLIRSGRADNGKRRRIPNDLRQLAEGLALEKPVLGTATIHRQLCRTAKARGDRPRRSQRRSPRVCRRRISVRLSYRHLDPCCGHTHLMLCMHLHLFFGRLSCAQPS